METNERGQKCHFVDASSYIIKTGCNILTKITSNVKRNV